MLYFKATKTALLYLINLWYVVCGENAFIKQINNRLHKILRRSAVMTTSLIQNQVHQEQRVLLWPRYRQWRNMFNVIYEVQQ